MSSYTNEGSSTTLPSNQDWITFVSKYINYSLQRPFLRKRTIHFAHDEIVTQTKILKLSLPEKLRPSS